MNVDSDSIIINYFTTFKKGNFEIMSIYLHWKLKVDKYVGKKFLLKKTCIVGLGEYYKIKFSIFPKLMSSLILVVLFIFNPHFKVL